jgi:L-iditol 2-dehydrogenase
MRQALIIAPWKAGLVNCDDPTMGPREVLIRIKAVGLCTLEQRVYRGARAEYPFLGGHEVGGTVVESSSLRLPPATVVAVSTFPRCGTCELCTNGMDNLCGYRNRPARDSKEPWGPGGLSEYMSIREECVFPISGTVIAASLVEPLACVLHSISRAPLALGDSIAVFGLGVMGALHVLAAAEIGLIPIWVGLHGTSSPSRRLAASAIEFANVSAVELRGALISEGLSPKAAYCIRGGAEALRAAYSIVAPGGTIVNFASPPNSSIVPIEMKEMRSNEVSLCASVNHTLSDFAGAARMACKMARKLENLVAERFPLSSINEALTRAVQTDLGRIVVEP